MEGRSKIIGNKLIVTEAMGSKQKGSFLRIVCLNLEKLKDDWSIDIPKDRDHVLGETNIEQDGDNIIVRGYYACYSIDIKTGIVKGKVPWYDFFKKSDLFPLCNVQNNKLYVTDYDHDNDLRCIDMSANNVIWHLKNARYCGLYKNRIIAFTPDDKFFQVLIRQPESYCIKYISPKAIKVTLILSVRTTSCYIIM